MSAWGNFGTPLLILCEFLAGSSYCEFTKPKTRKSRLCTYTGFTKEVITITFPEKSGVSINFAFRWCKYCHFWIVNFFFGWLCKNCKKTSPMHLRNGVKSKTKCRSNFVVQLHRILVKCCPRPNFKHWSLKHQMYIIGCQLDKTEPSILQIWHAN